MSNNQNNQAPKNSVNEDNYHDYFLKYLDNKKMTFSKKLEKIEALKLKDKNKLEKGQIEMIEKKDLWHERIAYWNVIRAHYMESIKKYKPELLNPSLGENEESKLRVQINELNKEKDEMQKKLDDLQAQLDSASNSVESKAQEVAETTKKTVVDRVVKWMNWVNCNEVYGDSCCGIGEFDETLKEAHTKVSVKLALMDEVPENLETNQNENLLNLVSNEEVWKVLGGKCCSEGVWSTCKQNYIDEKKKEEAKKEEEEEKAEKERQEEEKKKAEEEQRLKEENEKEPEEEYNNFVDDEDEEESEEEIKETKNEEPKKENTKPVENKEQDAFDIFFTKKETSWVKVEGNKPPTRGNKKRGNNRRGNYKKRNYDNKEGEESLEENNGEKRGNRGNYRGNNRRGNRGNYRGNNRRGNRGNYRGNNRRGNRGNYRGNNRRGNNEENSRGGFRGKRNHYNKDSPKQEETKTNQDKQENQNKE